MNVVELRNRIKGFVSETNGYEHRKPAPVITCDDGVTLSVQAGETLYCTPRKNNAEWTEVEVGFPDIVPPESWMQYCEDGENPTATVYAYIPIELVVEFINDHNTNEG